MNLWVGTGRLTANPELKTLQNGSVCNFTVACNKSYKKEGQPAAEFILCTAWGKIAEFISKYFIKGSFIEIKGEITNQSWQDNDGKKRFTTKINVSEAQFGGEKKDNAQNNRNNTYTNNNYSTDTAEEADVGTSDDELPF